MMQPGMPVRELRLETFTSLSDQLGQATSFYHKTLEKVVVQSSHNSEELGRALIRMVEKCSQLRILLVYCVIDKGVVERILQLLPEMKQRGSYILKWQKDPWPWTACGDIEEDDYDDIGTQAISDANMFGP
ncbi:hypothetical protein BaRGS_00036134 [Batillaria attramentaria]|uniref:Uncharacterized protein n=1 Tax=Batillaria attramentaria TaxID=370345 RepID=A0ABD0JCT0_9CAEN